VEFGSRRVIEKDLGMIPAGPRPDPSSQIGPVRSGDLMASSGKYVIREYYVHCIMYNGKRVELPLSDPYYELGSLKKKKKREEADDASGLAASPQ
jgi:hypothetical protein